MSKQTQFKKYQILGVEIDATTNAQAVDYIVNLASNPKSAANFVVKPYVEFLDLAQSMPQIATLLNQAELCIPDGVALHWAATYLYGGRHSWLRWFWTLCQIILSPRQIHRLLPGRASGVNFTWPMLEAATEHSLKIFLIGTPDQGRGDIRVTAAAIKDHLPQVNIVGHYGGYFPPGDKAELLKLLKTARPDLILVGMGFPRQEQLMAVLAAQLQHGVLVGEGGTFDYQSFGGRRPKAPRLLQIIGLEWLWRLILEPSRLRRQLAIPRFMWQVYLAGQAGSSG